MVNPDALNNKVTFNCGGVDAFNSNYSTNFEDYPDADPDYPDDDIDEGLGQSLKKWVVIGTSFQQMATWRSLPEDTSSPPGGFL